MNNLRVGFELQRNAKSRKSAVTVMSLGAATHIAIVGQSGSGKSFFLGRFIEELILNTQARVVILDPNSDFVRAGEVNEALWTSKNAREVALRRLLPPGDDLKSFVEGWKGARKVIFANRGLPNESRLLVKISSLSLDEILLCLGLDGRTEANILWYLTFVLEVCRGDYPTGFGFDDLRKVSYEIRTAIVNEASARPELVRSEVFRFLKLSLSAADADRFLAILERHWPYDIWWSRDQGILGHEDIGEYLQSQVTAKDGARLIEVDLLSMPSRSEQLAVLTRALTAIWTIARDRHSRWLLGSPSAAAAAPDRKELGMTRRRELLTSGDVPPRVPIFVVVDEAHNLVANPPSVGVGASIGEQLIRIAAEGRKFGLFLIVATQRPSKLHRSVLTECDNLFLMKMTNAEDCAEVARDTGLLSVQAAIRAKQLQQGEVIATGRLFEHVVRFATSPRRTIEGGASLTETWTSP
jgi:hypothetical protein